MSLQHIPYQHQSLCQGSPLLPALPTSTATPHTSKSGRVLQAPPTPLLQHSNFYLGSGPVKSCHPSASTMHAQPSCVTGQHPPHMATSQPPYLTFMLSWHHIALSITPGYFDSCMNDSAHQPAVHRCPELPCSSSAWFSLHECGMNEKID